ncbi:aminomethyl-transferring glycine dehydrogenase subunit GcvPA [Calditrichota bacterium]
MDYTLHSNADREAMLNEIGVASIKELIDRVLPEKYQLNRTLDISEGISELELARKFKEVASKNLAASESLSFLGGGAYDHYIPSAIGQMLNRSEFYTAYTPYQAEVSQGTLQTIYEFQTMVCRLMGMDAANASHYDGASSLAEGVILAVRKTKRQAIAVPETLNPAYLQVLETYCKPLGIEIRLIAAPEGVMSLDGVNNAVQESAALVIQHPNYYGLFEEVEKAASLAAEAGALTVASVNPMSLALFKPPGEWGADIATAEGQVFGASLNLGGPYVGLFAVKSPLVRLIPGRVVAAAEDTEGRSGFVLTMQTREQHIRRAKATSNICTNEALIALGSLIYLSLVGRDGLKRAAMNSYRGAHYLANGLKAVKCCSLPYSGEFFNEFVLETSLSSKQLRERLLKSDIMAGPIVGDETYSHRLLIAVTEKRSKKDLDAFIAAVEDSLTN